MALALQFGGGRGPLLDVLCVGWILLRIGHGVAYVSDRATLRSIIWIAALAVNIAIFLTPALT